MSSSGWGARTQGIITNSSFPLGAVLYRSSGVRAGWQRTAGLQQRLTNQLMIQGTHLHAIACNPCWCQGDSRHSLTSSAGAATRRWRVTPCARACRRGTCCSRWAVTLRCSYSCRRRTAAAAAHSSLPRSRQSSTRYGTSRAVSAAASRRGSRAVPWVRRRLLCACACGWV